MQKIFRFDVEEGLPKPEDLRSGASLNAIISTNRRIFNWFMGTSKTRQTSFTVDANGRCRQKVLKYGILLPDQVGFMIFSSFQELHPCNPLNGGVAAPNIAVGASVTLKPGEEPDLSLVFGQDIIHEGPAYNLVNWSTLSGFANHMASRKEAEVETEQIPRVPTISGIPSSRAQTTQVLGEIDALLAYPLGQA